jgi:HD-GYP domain-containing protein (c-di-GMP phosphodiesterase class II)
MTARDDSGKEVVHLIERAKQELEQMIDLCPQIMLLARRDGTLLRANRAVLSLIGQPDIRKLRGATLDSFLNPQPPDFFRDFLGSLDGFREADIRIEPHGAAPHILRIAAISSKGADTIAVQVRNLTADSASGETAREQKEVVEAVVGGLMHHLNQPLTVIMLRSYLMETELSRNTPDLNLLRNHLRDMMNLTMHVADLLQHAGHPVKVATVPYVGKTRIFDLVESAGDTALTSSPLPIFTALSDALDMRLPGYSKHAERTAVFAVKLAGHLGLGGLATNTVRRAAFVHDIGKSGVPDAILLKPQHLSPEETVAMRRHVEIGRRIVAGLGFLSEEAGAVATHHERFDGNGYPDGLSGETIPRPARIVAVADAFDAMRGARTYQGARPIADVVQEIHRESGRQFDPEVVAALDRCWPELDAMCPE